MKYREFLSRDIIALLTIPMIFASSSLTMFFTKDIVLLSILDTILRLIIFLVLTYLFKNLLADQWKKFKKFKKRIWFLIVIYAILLQIIISVSSIKIPHSVNQQLNNIDTQNLDILTVNWNTYWILTFISLGPTVTALIEDIVFKHVLLEKLLTHSNIFNIILIVTNSALFGIIHYYNFGSFISTVPYMFAALFLNLIYVKYRNIWPVLLIHFLNNFILSTVSTLFIGLFRYFI